MLPRCGCIGGLGAASFLRRCVDPACLVSSALMSAVPVPAARDILTHSLPAAFSLLGSVSFLSLQPTSERGRFYAITRVFSGTVGAGLSVRIQAIRLWCMQCQSACLPDLCHNTIPAPVCAWRLADVDAGSFIRPRVMPGSRLRNGQPKGLLRQESAARHCSHRAIRGKKFAFFLFAPRYLHPALLDLCA